MESKAGTKEIMVIVTTLLQKEKWLEIRQLLLAKINTLSIKMVLRRFLKVLTMDELSLST